MKQVWTKNKRLTLSIKRVRHLEYTEEIYRTVFPYIETTEVQIFYFKGRQHSLIWYDLTHNQTHQRSILIFIVTKFGADWFIFVDARE